MTTAPTTTRPDCMVECPKPKPKPKPKLKLKLKLKLKPKPKPKPDSDSDSDSKSKSKSKSETKAKCKSETEIKSGLNPACIARAVHKLDVTRPIQHFLRPDPAFQPIRPTAAPYALSRMNRNRLRRRCWALPLGPRGRRRA
ncbi:hypothetical protein [Pararobbsia silviterrae]|uniref:hypothetical protein n=1 Tax=Pararobbsia silviterrae TaxID=1792498 RepID=UPI0013146E88|nr:hypothetical protein [Pararobbsia silviterrae]